MHNVYRAIDLRKWSEDVESPSGEWIPARPLNSRCASLMQRLLSAWRVFTGRYDALDWEDE